jgi:hypothetical protein
MQQKQGDSAKRLARAISLLKSGEDSKSHVWHQKDVAVL